MVSYKYKQRKQLSAAMKQVDKLLMVDSAHNMFFVNCVQVVPLEQMSKDATKISVR